MTGEMEHVTDASRLGTATSAGLGGSGPVPTGTRRPQDLTGTWDTPVIPDHPDPQVQVLATPDLPTGHFIYNLESRDMVYYCTK